MWIGTPLGLGRFDGSTFTWFTREKNGIPFNNISGIAEDAAGNLLVIGNASEERQIFLFDPVKHETVASCNPERIPKGTYFIGINKLQDGRILVNASNNKRLRMDGTTSDGKNFYENYVWDAAHGFSPSRVPGGYFVAGIMWEENAYLVEDSNNKLSLLSVDGRILKKVNAPFGQGAACGLNLSVNRYIIDPKTSHTYRISPELDIRDVTSELPVVDKSDNQNLFDVGIDSIFWRGKLYHPEQRLLRDFVKEGMDDLRARFRCIFAEKNNNGRIWICGDFGLYQLSISRNKFSQYFGKGNEAAIGHNSYRSILVHDNCLYCCNEGLGVYKRDFKTGRCTRVVEMPPGMFGCYALAVDPAGDLTGSLGTDIFLLGQGKPVRLLQATPDRHNRVWSMYEYASGKFFLGMAMGIMLFDKEQEKFFPFNQYDRFSELEYTTVLSISNDRAGKLWVCCGKGFYLLDTAKGIMERFSRDDSGKNYLPAKEFQHFYQDDDGIYWLASTDGLIRWDKQHAKYRLYTRTDGLSNNNIYSVYPDAHNRLWLSSDYGIMQFDKSTGAVKSYLEGDGLSDNEFNRKSHYMDDHGNIYFGSLNGITSFNPADFADTSNKRPAKLAVASFQQFNGKNNRLEDREGELLQTNKITMLPDDRFFTLEFSLLNYNDPEQTTYYWKIDGIDTGWNVQKDRALRFSRLPYGKRTLHIKAQAADGTWSANELSFWLDIVSPFYLQTWFIVSAILGICVLAFGAYKWRVRYFMQETKRLDLVVQQKTSDLQSSLAQKDVLMKEIHHRVKNNLQVISTLLDLQLDNIVDEKARKALTEGMGRVKSIGLIHQQLYKENDISTLEFSRFAADLFKQVTSLFKKPGQAITFNADIRELYLDIDTAVPLGLILNELITNSYKYAFDGNKDGSISIGLYGNSDVFELTYSDSGPGLPADYDRSKSSSLGMMVIESLAKQLGGGFVYDTTKKKFIITFKGQEERKKIA